MRRVYYPYRILEVVRSIEFPSPSSVKGWKAFSGSNLTLLLHCPLLTSDYLRVA